MAILLQFVLRLAFGLALAMALTSPKQVTSGFYRNHLYVLLGLFVLAFLIGLSDRSQYPYALALAGLLLSYAGAVFWLYEKPVPGLLTLGLIAAVALAAACRAPSGGPVRQAAPLVLEKLAPFSGGLVVGTTIAAMFLGHWYLNSPTMQMSPLRRLLLLMGLALLLRAIVSGVGLAMQFNVEGQGSFGSMDTSRVWLLALRWLAGILAPLVLGWMSWKTLDIPNTQSATGILYVAVMLAFTGELTAQLLSTASMYPL